MFHMLSCRALGFPSDSWDCVTTCFFIDTAHNVIEYVETIWKILKPGGAWINLGESVRLRQKLHVCVTAAARVELRPAG